MGRSLAPGGTPLGHEALVADVGCSFNSPASLHLDEAAVWNRIGVQPNGLGLIDSYDEALAGCRAFATTRVEGPAPQSQWFPGLLVRYPLESPACHRTMRLQRRWTLERNFSQGIRMTFNALTCARFPLVRVTPFS
jgi:hypothetical protein